MSLEVHEGGSHGNGVAWNMRGKVGGWAQSIIEVKSKSKVEAEIHSLLYDKRHEITVKQNEGLLGIFKVIEYLVIIHKVNKPLTRHVQDIHRVTRIRVTISKSNM